MLATRFPFSEDIFYFSFSCIFIQCYFFEALTLVYFVIFRRIILLPEWFLQHQGLNMRILYHMLSLFWLTFQKFLLLRCQSLLMLEEIIGVKQIQRWMMGNAHNIIIFFAFFTYLYGSCLYRRRMLPSLLKFQAGGWKTRMLWRWLYCRYLIRTFRSIKAAHVVMLSI